MDKKRLSADGFLDEIRIAKQWAVMVNGISNELELWVKEDGDETLIKYLGPDLSQMYKPDLLAFLNTIRAVCGEEQIKDRRFIPDDESKKLPPFPDQKYEEDYGPEDAEETDG